MNINNMLQRGQSGQAAERANDAWGRIQEKPVVVTLVRNRVALDPQTVRIEWNNSASNTTQESGPGGTSSKRFGTLFGLFNHATLPDTDVQRDDRFALADGQYRVMSVMNGVGEKQAAFEVME